MDQQRIEFLQRLFLVSANHFGQGVLDSQIVVQELAVGIGHDSFGVFGLRGFERCRHHRIVRLESRFGDDSEHVAPVKAAFLAVESGRDIAVVRAGSLRPAL